MEIIEANLPALGSYTIQFHEESAEIFRFLGSKEIKRLDAVDHLGITSSVFTGIKHSRLEYMLLQCAVINLLTKLHKGKQKFALSGKVVIPGQKNKISSGEELLKCWALLGNSGHPQYTFGVERSLLNHARQDISFRKIIIDSLPSDLKPFGNSVIDEYKDEKFHYLLTAIKVSNLPRRSRLKGNINRILSSLLLSGKDGVSISASDYYKLYRLKTLYSRIRLLCIVALDSYYSHHPLRFQISSAVLNLDVLLDDAGMKSEFHTLMENSAAWLADEIYMHPLSAAAQKFYEVDSREKINGVYKPRFSSRQQFIDFMPNFMNSGFGQPKPRQAMHLARLSFPYVGAGPILGKDLYSISENLNRQLTTKMTYISVLLNPYSNRLHIDLLYNREFYKFTHISQLYIKTITWLLRLVEAQIIYKIRALRVPNNISGDIKNRLEENIRKRSTTTIMKDSNEIFQNFFLGIIKFLLPDDLVGYFSEALPTNDHSLVGYKFSLVGGDFYDNLSEPLDKLIKLNTRGLDKDRIHELVTLQNILIKSKAPYIFVCMEKYVIRDISGMDKDDWDGVILKIFPDKVNVSILEAKNISPKTACANQAFKQLESTQKLLKKKHNLPMRRKRISGCGAILTITI